MTKLLFSGCSIPCGTGLDLEKDDVANYCNVFASACFDEYTLHNIAVPGNSNFEIFLSTSMELVHNTYDFVFVGWTSYPRQVVQLGVEEYNSRRTLIPGSDLIAYSGNDISFSSNYLNAVRDKFLLLINDHYSILEIVKYVNILYDLAKLKKTKIYFINNYCSWDENYFKVISKDIISSNLTPYTNKILNSSNRDDKQISILYNKMHKDYTTAGTIKESLWLNLYKNIKVNKMDLGNDNYHPGPLTHKNYGKFLSECFDKIF